MTQHGGAVIGTEDCLYLDVYSPSPLKGKPGPYPVLFYIHGGGLMWGSSQQDDFTKLVSRANEGLVVVMVNYRTNIYGFLATAELSEEQGGTSGNYGIRDQILGLEWVRDNIIAFSGDPEKVTIGMLLISSHDYPPTRLTVHVVL